MSENPLTNGMGHVSATLLTEDVNREKAREEWANSDEVKEFRKDMAPLIEHLTTEPEQPEEMAGDILSRMGLDALAWAEQFRKISVGLSPDDRLDIGYLVGWFANAIEAGRTAGAQQRCPHLYKDLFITGDLILCGLCGAGLSHG